MASRSAEESGRSDGASPLPPAEIKMQFGHLRRLVAGLESASGPDAVVVEEILSALTQLESRFADLARAQDDLDGHTNAGRRRSKRRDDDATLRAELERRFDELRAAAGDPVVSGEPQR